MNDWLVVLLDPAKKAASQIMTFLVNLLLVLIILVIGWLVSKFIKTAITSVLRALRLDDLSDRIELDALLAKGGIKSSLSELIGVIFYWLSLLVTFIVALNTVGLTFAPKMLDGIVGYIPNIIAAIFILVLAMFVATLLRNIIQTTANNAGVAKANLLAKIVEVAVIVFAVIIALEQLNIASKIIELTVSILLGSLGLAVALAFGLGCKEIAGKALGDLIDKIKK